jgi:hypothetical protein
MIKLFKILLLIPLIGGAFCDTLLSQNRVDTSYDYVATPRVQKLLAKGKAPVVTLQLSGFYNIGLMDLAANDNTVFSKNDFVAGRDYGTRYGIGVGVIGKIAVQKKGFFRIVVSANYNRFQSNFIISESPEGRVYYNVFSGGLGIENNFIPDGRLKPFVGFEIVPSIINGNATLTTDSADFNVKIRNNFRIGLAANVGFEYAFNNNVGLNLGIKFTHANLFLKESKASPGPDEIYLNDQKVTPNLPYAGWKQFFYTSFFTGVNYYFGMKNKK